MIGNDIPPCAFIKHELPGRVRLKIPQKRSDFGYFDRLAEIFTQCQGITQLQLNPPAASILICHKSDVTFQDIAAFAETNSVFSLTEKPDDDLITIPNLPIASLTSSGLSRLDYSLQDFSRGRLDTRSLLFLTLIGMAVHQMTRGHIMAPAASFLWYALEVLKQGNGNRLRDKNPTDSEKSDLT